MTQQIVVSTMPWKDYGRNKWMLSASMSIQLDGNAGATLGTFPDILHWIDRLKGAAFAVQWNNGRAQDIAVTSDYWDAALYANLFTGAIVVKPFQPLNASNLTLKSYPVAHIRDFILNTYNDVGNLTPGILPTSGFYVQQYKKLAVISRVQPGVRETAAHPGKVQAAQMISRNRVIPFSTQPNPVLDFGQLHNYFDISPGIKLPPPPVKPVLEYHDILSIIMDYPIIQRKLGLILDFELSGPPPAASGTVRIIPSRLGFTNAMTLSAPPTAYETTANGFYMAAKAGSVIDKGMLLLNSADFSVVEIDTEGSAMKLTGHTDSMYLASEGNNDPEGLPALRSAGIGIVHNGLAAKLAAKFTRMSTMYKDVVKQGAGGSTVLYADDLVKGYRIDISYDSAPGVWYSLHARNNRYAYAPLGGAAQAVALPTDPFVDEGCIQLSLTQDVNDASGAQRLNEVIARWEGWSLTVPRLGKSVNNTGDPVSSDADEQKKYQLDDSVVFRLQVNTLPAPRTLPLLRFGQTYSIKIRTVDLCGNSLPYAGDPENKAAAVRGGVKYYRYEPLPVATLREGTADRDGESLELLAIRSNFNVSSTEQAVRHVLAPPASQLLAETHGMFDAAFKDPAQAAAFYTFIASKDKATVNDPSKPKAPVYPAGQQQVDIEWLADPMAAGVILTMESTVTFETPWQKGVSRQFSFYFDDEVTAGNAGTPYSVDAWKKPKSFRVILLEGNAAPSWDASSRSLTIYLPKSAQVQINYACFWRPDDLTLVSGMHACVNNLKTETPAAQLALRGLHWMFSPWRVLRLVHAVQQPLQAPQFEKNASQVVRNYGDTFVYITTRIDVHGPSSDKIDIGASWTEWKDDLTGDGPKQISNTAHVDTIQCAYTDKVISCAIAARIGSGGIGDKKGNGGIGGTLKEPMTVKVPIYQAFGDTRHRMIDYVPVATTRYREYFAGLIATAAQNKQPFPLTQTGAVVSLNILSSERPVLPAIDYVLPSFSWASTVKGNTTTHVRTGNIRVYVQRPWYSSGDDERLAVILGPKGANVAGNASLTRYCTVWGKDPVFSAPELNNSNYPTTDNFPYAVDYDTVRLAEDNNTEVAVSGYAANYDVDKQLYFFDIPVNILSAYYPFVKLTLARYQRNSLRTNGTDCCLSKLVSVDWMQVVPARETALVLDSGGRHFTITLKGTAPFGTGNPRILAADNDTTRTRIRVQVQSAVVPKTEDVLIITSGSTIWQKDFDIGLTAIKNGAIQFSTTVQLDKQWGSKPYRVLLSEYELHPFDPLRTELLTRTGQPKDNQQLQWSERLVFMDQFDVNGVV